MYRYNNAWEFHCMLWYYSVINVYKVADMLVGVLKFLLIIYIQGRLNELMAQIRLRNPLGSAKLNSASGYQVDPNLQTEIHAVSIFKF